MCVERHDECPLPSWSLALPAVRTCYSHTWSQSPPSPSPASGHTPPAPAPSASSQPFWSEVAAEGTSAGETGAPSSRDPPGPTEALQQHSPREPLAGPRQARLGSRDTAISHTGSCPGAVSQLGSFGNRQPGGWRGSRPVSPTQTSSRGEEAVV